MYLVILTDSVVRRLRVILNVLLWLISLNLKKKSYIHFTIW